MLTISLLGEQAIIDEATGNVRTRSSRSVALVAYLAVHAGTPQTRQRIAALFWPDSTDGQALTNLRRELHHLREALDGTGSLSVTTTDLCWRDTAGCRVDVRSFLRELDAAVTAAGDEELMRHGKAALRAYGGDLLPGMYDDWVLESRADLARSCTELCDLLVPAGRRTDDPAAALEAARRRIAMQPLEEAGYRTLMRLQAELADRAGAISTYHHCASVLERELGIEPDPATTGFLNQLIVGDADGPPPHRSQAAVSRSGVAEVELVGRDAELAVLDTTLRESVTGRLRVALVSGDAGVGKSRLVAELARLAEQGGVAVATAHSFGTSHRLALAPVADWLRDPGFRSTSQTLEPVWRTEVERLVPTEQARAPTAGSRAMVDAWQRHRFFEGLARALVAARRPTLLVLENLQWCDEETLSFLSFLMGLAPDAQVMVAATGRADEISSSPGHAGWLNQLRGSGFLVEVPLAPFGRDETAELAGLLARAPLAEVDTSLLHAATGGFALYVVEAARSAGHPTDAVPLPDGDFTGVLRHRIDQTSPAAKEIAGLAAAFGRDFGLDLLTEASDLDPDAVVRAVDELWRRRIFREYGGGYDFAHDLLRDTAYAEVSPPRRWLLHRRLAQSLELLYAGSTDEVAAQLADQYSRGGSPQRALGYYRRAAEVAAGIFAHAAAVKHHRAALALLRTLPATSNRDAQELGIRKAMSAPLNALRGYAAPELEQTLERMVLLAERLGRRETLIDGLVGLWASRFVQGRTTQAHELATRMLSLVDPGSRLSGQAHFSFAGSALQLGMPQQSAEHFELACARSVDAESLSVGSRPAIHGRAWSAHAYWLLGRPGRAAECCAEAVDRARAVQHPYSLTIALAYAGVTYQMLGDVESLSRSVPELAELSERYGFVYYCDWGMVLAGWARGGSAGVDLAQQGIRNLRGLGAFARMPYWLSLLADISDDEAARATLDAAQVAAEARDDRCWIPEIIRMRAARAGSVDDAAARLRAAADIARVQGSSALLERCSADLRALGGRRTLSERTGS